MKHLQGCIGKALEWFGHLLLLQEVLNPLRVLSLFQSIPSEVSRINATCIYTNIDTTHADTDLLMLMFIPPVLMQYANTDINTTCADTNTIDSDIDATCAGTDAAVDITCTDTDTADTDIILIPGADYAVANYHTRHALAYSASIV